MKRRKPPSKRPKPQTPEEMFRRAVGMLLQINSDVEIPSQCKARIVMDAMKAALEHEPPLTTDVRVDGEVETCLTDAGLFRLVMDQSGIDRHDLREQERLLVIVQKEVERLIEAG